MSKRVDVIDFIRGFAVLGLPTMNLVGFSMPVAAYFNPFAFSEESWLHHPLFSIFHILADQKFMGLFAMLYGVSMLLFIDTLSQRNGNVAGAHYSRTFWLLVIGVLHFSYLWEGDVLTIYAFLGLFLYLLKGFSVGTLSVLSLLFLSASMWMSSIHNLSTNEIGESSRGFIESMYAPSDEQIEVEITRYRSDYATMLNSEPLDVEQEMDEPQEFEDLEPSIHGELVFLYLILGSIFRALSMMLLGMALYKVGFIQGRLSPRHYKTIAAIAGVIGLGVSVAGVVWNYSHSWSLDLYFSYGMLPNILGGYFLCVSYAALLILFFSSCYGHQVKAYVSCVGRLALTNYLMQSVVCSFLFYGWGLGLFASLTRAHLLLPLILLWVGQMAFSVLWLRYFTQGPIEWCWRCLTYWKIHKVIRSC